MIIFEPQNWPLLVICILMILSAVIDWWKFKVPNKLTFPIILAGWILGFLHWPLGYESLDAGRGGVGAAFATCFLGMAVMMPIYIIEGMGAGDVKMTMGFGAWIGAFYGFDYNCIAIFLWAWCLGVIFGGVIGIFMILLRFEFAKNMDFARNVMLDLSSGSLATIRARSKERRPFWHRLPYGVPLCIGFVTYLIFWQPTAPGSVAPIPDQQTQRVSHAPPIAWLADSCP